MPSDRPVNRRNFFREGLREFLRPLADTIADKIDAVAKEFSKASDQFPAEPALYTPSTPYASQPATPAAGPWLRPPGASYEALFVETCARSGHCVRSCPVQAIRLDYSGVEGGGAPYIKADEAACALCDGLFCMQNCPSGAITPIPRLQITMGTAVWEETTCERTHGGECTACFDHCPLALGAIAIDGNRVKVLPGCVGCGMCEQSCPTNPRSIRIKPKG